MRILIFLLLASKSWLLPAAPPNLVFLLADDMRADTIAALGNRHIRTPHLDRLVREGTAFGRAYIMGSMQGAVCVPSRAMMMSGRPLFSVSSALKDTVTWPMTLRGGGYETFGCGKWHNGAASFAATFPNGRSVFLGGMADPFKLPVQDVGPGGKMVNPRTNEAHSSVLFAGQAAAFLREQKGASKPFALYVAFTAPHDPRRAPAEFHAQSNAAKPPLPGNFLPEHPFNNGEMTVRDEQLLPWPRTAEAVRQELADYYAVITHLDSQIGVVLDALQATGRAGETVVIFAADNGLALGSHGLMGKQNLYEHSMRVPLIIGGPGLPKGRTTDALCYLFDLFPTLCELAQVRVPASVQGRSLLPVLKEGKAVFRESIFTAYSAEQRALTGDRYKLIRYTHINKSQLFDLKSDPQETRDLAAEPAHQARLAARMQGLGEAQKRYADARPLSTDTPAPLRVPLQKPPRGKGGD